jgi:O-methyltransferase involved in polyketide biosynthesis
MELKTNTLHKIRLTKIQETLLITLQAKALDNRSAKPILHDRTAEAMLGSIDFDFEKFNGLGNDNVIVVRAKQYDEWLKEFLRLYPQAVVVNLGCGLDTRVTRISPPEGAQWFDVDYPDVIQLRQNFYSNNAQYQMIGSSVTESGWLESMPKDRPTIIIAEGLLEYLTEQEVQTLFNRLTDHFGQGQLAFDVMDSYAVRSAQAQYRDEAGAIHKWAVDDLGAVDKLDAKLKRIGSLSLFESAYIQKLPWKYRWIYGAMARIPKFSKMMRLCRYAF